MPLLRVELWPGRSPEAKKKLARELTDVVVENIGCPRSAVTIVFTEVPKGHWVIGGSPCDESHKDGP